MAHLKKYTDEYRRELVAKGGESLFFFCKGILGYKDLEEKPHLELCENLDGRGTWGQWNRGLVTASRGFLKSSICTIGWPIREGLYKVNWSCRILGSSWENVKMNFFDKITAIFKDSGHRDFLLWLYGDPSNPQWYRIPRNFEGWTDRQIVFRRTDPLATPAITYKGMGSDQEGWHGNAVIIDDPEGADSTGGSAASEEARRTVHSVAPPLLIDPRTGQILVVATPHGDQPLVYQILEDKNGRIEWDNDKRAFKQWFKPILGPDGKPTWPERYGEAECKMIQATEDEKTWDQQRMLRKTSSASSMFDFDLVRRAFFKYTATGVIEYPVRLMDEKAWYERGEYLETLETRRVHPREMRYYLHVDFTHRKDTVSSWHGNSRPARPSVVAVGVAPDFHAFVLGYWSPQEKSDLDEHARQIYRYYAKFGAFQVTYDPVGAQAWFSDYAEKLEKSETAFQRMKSSGQWSSARMLPRLSSRLVEDKRTTRESKESVISDRLMPWFKASCLHLHEKHDELLFQIKGFPDDTPYVDIVDALAQGPPVWQPPLGGDKQQHLKDRNSLQRRIAQKHTGYYNPYPIGATKPEQWMPDAPEGAVPENVTHPS